MLGRETGVGSLKMIGCGLLGRETVRSDLCGPNSEMTSSINATLYF